MLRYGIVGAGMMGQEHIRSIALLDDAQVSAVADPNDEMREASRELAGPECRSYVSYEELLAADVCDALVIATPNDTHYPILKDVLSGDLPILVEKPLCITPEQCREVIVLAKGRRAPVWVGMEYRYMPPVARLLEELRAGTAGRIRMISIAEHRFPFLNKVGDWNRFNARSGGTMVEKCCHFFDLFRLIAGSSAERVYASAGMDVNFLDESYAGKKPDVLDNAFVTVDFANRIRAMLELCMFSEGSRWQEVISVTGDKGRVTARVPGPSRLAQDDRQDVAQLTIANRATGTETTEEVAADESILAAGDHYGSCFFQHQRFVRMLSADGIPEVSIADGLAAVEMGAAAEKSASSGEAVAFA